MGLIVKNRIKKNEKGITKISVIPIYAGEMAVSNMGSVVKGSAFRVIFLFCR
jgi:hypothetical protein